MEWSKALIRCSSLGLIMTDPRDKAAKESGELSKTAKSHLKSVYIDLKYHRKKDIVTKQMAKGIQVEEESITLLSRVQKKMLFKNEERLNNEYITGLPDIYEGESIHKATSITDIKSSYDLHTFLANIGEPLDSTYFYQLQGYMALSGANTAYIAYCLVDTPQSIIEGEKYRLLKSMDVISEEDPAFKQAALQIELNMTFSDIPKEERVLIFRVERSETMISKIYERVEKAREFLAEFEEMHLNFNK